jgi:uncharacterized membrane protein
MTADSPESPENELAKSNLPRGLTPDEDLKRAVEATLGANLEKLPPQDRQTFIQGVTTLVTMAGPLPPPAIARQFEEMCPGFVDRSLKMAETAQRAEIDARADERQKNQNYRVFGMACAGLITLTLIISGVYIAVNVNVYAGVGTALITFVASAVAAFINGRPLADETKEAQPSTAQPPTAKGKQQPLPPRKRTKR